MGGHLNRLSEPGSTIGFEFDQGDFDRAAGG